MKALKGETNAATTSTFTVLDTQLVDPNTAAIPLIRGDWSFTRERHPGDDDAPSTRVKLPAKATVRYERMMPLLLFCLPTLTAGEDDGGGEMIVEVEDGEDAVAFFFFLDASSVTVSLNTI